MDTTAAVTHSEHFQALLEAGLPQKVAEKLDELYVAGKRKFHLICVLLLSPAFYLLAGSGGGVIKTLLRHRLSREKTDVFQSYF